MGGVPNFNTTSTSPPSQPATTPAPLLQPPSQKQRMQELQQKISQAEALLKNSAFATGPMANIVRQNLAANKAELARLRAQPQTSMMPSPAPKSSPASIITHVSHYALPNIGHQAAARQNAAAVSQNPSYSANANTTIVIPASQQQQPMMGGGQGQGAIVMGGSTAELVNSYYKKQLLGFLYKQG